MLLPRAANDNPDPARRGLMWLALAAGLAGLGLAALQLLRWFV